MASPSTGTPSSTLTVAGMQLSATTAAARVRGTNAHARATRRFLGPEGRSPSALNSTSLTENLSSVDLHSSMPLYFSTI